MKKLLIVSGSYPDLKCGVGDYTKCLVDALKVNKLDTLILTSNKVLTNSANVNNTVKKWSGFYIIKKILSVVKEYKPDVVNIQFPTSEYNTKSLAFCIFLPIIMKIKRIKVIYTIHEYSDCSKQSKKARYFAIKCSNKVIVVDERFKIEIENKYRLKNKVFYINIGSNIKKYSGDKTEVNQIRNEILLKYNCKRIISYFGFINDAKCFKEVLLAFGKLKENNMLTSCLLLIGELSPEKCNKEYFMELTQIIEHYKLSDNICITGFLDNDKVSKFICTSDAAILLFKNGVSIRNGSMLAFYQEGKKIYTSHPIYRSDFFDTDQFTFINNSVEDVYACILEIQNSNLLEFSPLEVSWDSIANKYIEIINEV